MSASLSYLLISLCRRIFSYTTIFSAFRSLVVVDTTAVWKWRVYICYLRRRFERDKENEYRARGKSWEGGRKRSTFPEIPADSAFSFLVLQCIHCSPLLSIPPPWKTPGKLCGGLSKVSVNYFKNMFICLSGPNPSSPQNNQITDLIVNFHFKKK